MYTPRLSVKSNFIKRSIFFLLLALFAFSCQEDQEPIDQFPQTWKIAGWQNSGFGGDLGFQPISDSTYTYLFKKDGTFLKTVGDESIAGTFRTEVLNYEIGGKRTTYTLFFPEDKLRNSCSANVEGMYSNENLMLVGESAACDGPTNFFSLMK